MNKLLKISIVLVLTGFFLVTVAGISRVYMAEIAYKQSRDSFRTRQITRARRQVSNAILLNKNEPAYYLQKARLELVLSNKEGVLDALQTAQKINPENKATMVDSIPLYYFLALTDIALQVQNPEELNTVDPTDNIDENYIALTEEYFDYVKQKYPLHVGTQVKIAKYERLLNLKGYSKTIESVKELRPDLLEWYSGLQ
jgi:tetratricopeptide (TPR) repeat protein